MSSKENLSKFLLVLAMIPLFGLASVETEGQVLFEGYSKVLVGGLHVGYAIQRYEFDAKSKTFTSISFLKTDKRGNNVTESLVAKANQAFQPISYQYTTTVGDQIKIIDATFKGQQMSAIVKNGKESVRVKKELEKGVFLSTFLGYLLLNNGVAEGKKYSFDAIAEEDGEVFKGSAFVKGKEKKMGVDTYVIYHKFRDSEFVANVTMRGEVLLTKSPLSKISTELVTNSKQATGTLDVPQSTLKLLFGGVPKGNIHPLALSLASNTEPSAEKQKILQGQDKTEPAGKKEGFPGGKGVLLKGGASGK